MEEFLDFVLVDEFAAVVCNEKFIQVEGVIDGSVLTGQVKALLYLLVNHVGKLVREHTQLRQGCVGIVVCVIRPVVLCFLFVGIRPVVYLLFGKLVAGQLLERGTGQVQRVLSLDVTEGSLGLHGVYAFLRFIDNQEVKFQLGHPLQLVELAAEIHGSL